MNFIENLTKNLNLSTKQKRIPRKVRELSRLAIQDIRSRQLGQILPIKPHTLNLLVNDVCNSRCQMCLIWQQKKEKEFSSQELEKILKDNLFCKLKYIGVSGGEPTLRSDLPNLFEVICSKKPAILGTGIITNGIIEDSVKQRILDSAEVCKSKKISFNVMISLDGIGEVHDTVRGRKNNFKSALALLKFFHEQTDIPTSFGCTITSSNVFEVDELVDYAKNEGLYGRFRIAEFIDRLYNDNQSNFIRSFNSIQKYHLGLFFFRIEHDYESHPDFRKTYANIRKMLTDGKSRQIGCPYQTQAAVLTAKGDLLYCAPKSPILGNTLLTAPSKLYFSNIAIRKQILKDNCSSCIHDYHESVTLSESISTLFSNFKNRSYSCQKLIEKSLKKEQKLTLRNIEKVTSNSVLIVGWYGTETAGDKAILWSIIKNFRTREIPPQKIYLSSLYPFISRWTLQEMNLEGITIIETYSSDFKETCSFADEIVVGGGPLMDTEALNHILYAFIKGTENRAITRIEGCGVGPLHDPLYRKVVSEIFRLSSYISLRDMASAERSKKDFNKFPDKVISDPATDYVLYAKDSGHYLEKSSLIGSIDCISCYLREWTTEYKGQLNYDDYLSLKSSFETQLTQMLISLASSKNLDIHLLPMHTFHIGGDDRVFNRKLANSLQNSLALFEKHKSEIEIKVCKTPFSPSEILQSMYHSKLNVCMRFHSVLFAETLGVPYIAIDYTGGGKIKAFLEGKGKLDRLITLEDVALGNWEKIVEFFLKFQFV